LVLGAVAAGCGSSSSSSSGARSSGSGASGSSSSASSGGVAEAQKLIAQFQQQPQQTEVTTAITTPVPTGKKIDFLTCSSPGCVVIAKDFTDAAKILGWQVKLLTVEATADKINKAYATVIQDKPDGVAVVAVSSAVAVHALAQLQTMKIPVVTAQDPEIPFGPIITSVYTSTSSLRTGKIHADDMIANGCDKGTTVYIDVGGFLVLKFMREGFQAEAARLAPQMNIDVVDIAATQEGNAQQAVVGAVRSKQAVCVFASSDPLATGLAQALKSAGVTSLPKIFTDYGADTTLTYIKSGLATSTNMGDSGSYGFIFADALARHFAGQSVEPDGKALQNIWLVNKTNAPASTPYLDVPDLQAKYKKLWGK
jgi:ribose transport system substrate-binding protein